MNALLVVIEWRWKMRGGLKMYRGSAAAARNYLEADRGRADDYYLAEGAGLAECYLASPAEGVRRVGTLSGEGYEAWVAGLDPVTGVPKGRLRGDGQAVRFVEVVVNGPKSWSLAAELHPDISAAYAAAQDRAGTQILAWLAQHATTRVGPRGRQVQILVQRLEAAVVRHYTSRAGDPHRHLHLQINARVRAEDQWLGLHTVGVRDSLDAINGIGHAAVVTDPHFRAAMAGHGFTVGEDGEISQLAEYVGPFSARAAQIGRNLDRYEAEWRAAHPGEGPGPALRRAGMPAPGPRTGRTRSSPPLPTCYGNAGWTNCKTSATATRSARRRSGDGGWVSWIATVAWPSCCPGWPPDAPGGTLPTSAAKSNSSLPEVA
jgi:exodeoxyribonuclease V alpha subunit